MACSGTALLLLLQPVKESWPAFVFVKTWGEPILISTAYTTKLFSALVPCDLSFEFQSNQTLKPASPSV
jgi:hypothetical protein